MTTDTKRLRELASCAAALALRRHERTELRSIILAACEELEAAREDARRYRFLASLCDCNSVTLGYNDDSAPNYVTVAKHIEDTPDWYSDVPPEELEKMKATNSDWQLQIYPNTPVGFNVYIGATLDTVIDEAMGDE